MRRVNIDRLALTQGTTRLESDPPGFVPPFDARRVYLSGVMGNHHLVLLDPHPFVLFGLPHLTAIAAAFAVPAALALSTRPLQSRRLERALCVALAVALAANWALWMLLLARRGWLALGDELPLNLCDWATIATIAALLRPNQRTYELAYFWALAGTLQGMLTPDVVNDFPDWQFILFFVFHSGIIASVLYLTFGLGFRPFPQSIPRVVLWSLVYGLVAGAADWLLGTNYGFLRAKPAYASLFDIMPSWPWYIPILVALGLVSVGIYYAPWYALDRIRAVLAPMAGAVGRAPHVQSDKAEAQKK